MRVTSYSLFFLLLLVTKAWGQTEDNVWRLVVQGNSAAQAGEYKEALSIYQQGLTLPNSKHHALLHYNIGVCYYQLGFIENAIDEYKIALVDKQQYQKAWFALGMAYYELQNWQGAKDAFSQAIKRSGNRDAIAAFKLGLLLEQEGDYKEAKEYFKLAIKQGWKRFPAAHNNLGIVFVRIGELDKARREFEIAVQQSDRQFEEAISNLALCEKLLSSPTKTLVANLIVWDMK